MAIVVINPGNPTGLLRFQSVFVTLEYQSICVTLYAVPAHVFLLLTAVVSTQAYDLLFSILPMFVPKVLGPSEVYHCVIICHHFSEDCQYISVNSEMLDVYQPHEALMNGIYRLSLQVVCCRGVILRMSSNLPSVEICSSLLMRYVSISMLLWSRGNCFRLVNL